MAAPITQHDEGDEGSEDVKGELAYGELPTEDQLKNQNAWLWYQEQLESGDAVDPTGQYVKKGTIQDSTSDAVRPKLTPDQTDWGFEAYVAAGHPVGTPKQTACADCLVPPPPAGGTPCARCGPPTFVSSELYSVNNEPVHDLRIILDQGTSSQSAVALFRVGYRELNADLNRGAGEKYIYFAYTHYANQVLTGQEYYSNEPYTGINLFVTGVETKTKNH